MWQTALIGVLAGAIGTLIGVVLGFTSAYFGGPIDGGIKGICQILTPIPVFLIQVVIAGSIDKRYVTIYTMAFIVVLLALDGPDAGDPLAGADDEGAPVRFGRQAFRRRRSGHHLWRDPAQSAAVYRGRRSSVRCSSAMFASFYLAVLGLGPLREPLLGNMIWAAQGQGAFFNGWWWWPIMPVAGAGADPGLAGADQYGPRRVRQSARAEDRSKAP